MRTAILGFLCSTFVQAVSAAPCPSIVWTKTHEIAGPHGGLFSELATLDFNGDGHLDLAGVVDGDQYWNVKATILLWLGAGNGSFSPPTTLLTGADYTKGEVTDLAAGDLNGDGFDDLIAGRESRRSLITFYGSADMMGPQTEQLLQYPIAGFRVGNFDGDPAPEMVASSWGRFFTFDNENGGLILERIVDIFGVMGPSLATADFNGDGLHDVAVVRRDVGKSTIEIYARSGGTLSKTLAFPAGDWVNLLSTADLNRDGRPDLVAVSDVVTVYLNGGGGSFSAQTYSPAFEASTAKASSLAFEDLTGDGFPDILAGAPGWIATFAGAGDGTFRTASYFSGRNEYLAFASISVGDFDEDGNPDLGAGTQGDVVIAARSCTSQVSLTKRSGIVSVGQSASVTVQVSGFSRAPATPYGTMRILEGQTEIAAVPVEATGRASFALSLPAGDHTLVASFDGNGEIGPATSQPFVQKVTTSTTRTVITAPSTPPVYGTPWPVGVTVVGSSVSQVVDLTVDGEVRQIGTDSPLNLFLSPGAHTIWAEFKGTETVPPSTSEVLTVTAVKADTRVRGNGDYAVRDGQPVSLYLSVTGPSGTPTGTIHYYEGNTLLASVELVRGEAYLMKTLPRGPHSIRGVYSGDSNFNGSESPIATITVVPDTPIWLDARGDQSVVRFSLVLPSGSVLKNIYRRPASGTWTALPLAMRDDGPLQRGIVYEYQVAVTLATGATQLSNIDGAILFNDDPLLPGTAARRAHFTELRDAVNLLRATAGLPAFAFDTGFGDPGIIRAAHLQGLRDATEEAIGLLGMSRPSWSVIAPGSVIRARDVQETRDLVR